MPFSTENSWEKRRAEGSEKRNLIEYEPGKVQRATRTTGRTGTWLLNFISEIDDRKLISELLGKVRVSGERGPV